MEHLRYYKRNAQLLCVLLYMLIEQRYRVADYLLIFSCYSHVVEC